MLIPKAVLRGWAVAALFCLLLGFGWAQEQKPVPVLAQPAQPGHMHTFDGRWDISAIDLRIVYYVPQTRTPLTDWRERVEYFAERLQQFHRREFGGQSVLRITVRPQPLTAKRTLEQLRAGDQNVTFYQTLADVREQENWPAARQGKAAKGAFPILLVLSDINWREMDDFRRERMVNGRPIHEGNVDRNGRNFPGAESGGARATYLATEGRGEGLVSADGWRVPYTGSDCVVYHEGMGHTVGLPHPEPIDSSVMGVAQYKGWLNETFINADQKARLGYVNPFAAVNNNDLFTQFTAQPEVVTPVAGQAVVLRMTWPVGAKGRHLSLETQTDLRGRWQAHRVTLSHGTPPTKVPIGVFGAGPVAYRVRAELADGQRVELYGYFTVKK